MGKSRFDPILIRRDAHGGAFSAPQGWSSEGSRGGMKGSERAERKNPTPERAKPTVSPIEDPWTIANPGKERTLAAIREAQKIEQRTWRTPEFGHFPMHKRRPRKGPHSRLEGRVVEFLHRNGVNSELCSFWVPDLINAGQRWKLTPDITVGGVAIEVDVDKTLGGGGYHLPGFPAHDTMRSDCLCAVGVRSIRLRIGNLEQVPSARNVLCGPSLSQHSLERLLDVLREELAFGDAGETDVKWPWQDYAHIT